MKRFWIICLLAALMLAGTAFAENAAPTTTIMVYMSGADLESDYRYASRDIREMVKVGPDSDGPITLLLATGGAEKWYYSDEISAENLQFHRITDGGLETVQALPAGSMGSAETLASFVEYGLTNHAADRYIFVFWGHGDGPTGGVCYDELFDEDCLTSAEITDAFVTALPEGEKIDAIVYDSCLMACADMVYAANGIADWIVASQETTVGSGMVYHEWIAELSADPDMRIQDLCRCIADSYIESNKGLIWDETSSISVLNVSYAKALQMAADRLYGALDRKLAENPQEIIDIRKELISFGSYTNVDPSDQVDAIAIADAFAEIAPAECAALRKAVKQCVYYNLTTEDLSGIAQGISLFMPFETYIWFDIAEDWYAPLASSSPYARFIVNMIDIVEEEYKPSLYDMLKAMFSSDSTLPENFVPLENIWQGLAAEEGSSGISPDSAAIAADDTEEANSIDNMWDGLKLPASEAHAEEHAISGFFVR